jgi:hypothetical protein
VDADAAAAKAVSATVTFMLAIVLYLEDEDEGVWEADDFSWNDTALRLYIRIFASRHGILRIPAVLYGPQPTSGAPISRFQVRV